MDHASLPDSYYANDLWHDSPLTDDEREALRDEIRQLVLAIKEEIHLDDIEHPGIGDIELTSFRDEDALNITVYLISDELGINPVGNETFDEEGEATLSDEAHYLRDLGHTWRAVEYDLISELVLMLDLPELSDELSDYLLGGDEHGPCLYCTMDSPANAAFSVTAHIPETTQRIYDNAEFELARKLNIPIDGASK
ncbi:hypothetical protein [Haloarchaeobius sp. FL176]|uniref:hypothetical protein n=1 Tax=Haloarchaeobius sp. FL176 TaxID=2967129 RepID=UPI002147EC85|nr:hypothetical protein [Haloarchaeobius sp. FL176]